MKRSELTKYLNEILKPQLFKDYGPNGLHIEGRENIKKIAFAVSATKKSIAKAVQENADTLIVHHGLFWKFHGVRTITGAFANRIKPLIQNDINLFGYHLPLDAHLEIGNAASLAALIGLTNLSPFGDHKGVPTGVSGEFAQPIKVNDLQEKIKNILDHDVMLSSHNSSKAISSLGIITGGANGDWVHCLENNIEAYLTGEMSEHDWHEAQESEVHMFAGGHHATEKFGVQSLMKKIQDELEIECFYIDSANPA
ncbi:Nif3-like dinuclear metal center hexameric protein [Bacteriovoracaceae bacterium]|nr:Nif3-like dinuclear metal center hexameric protein [Bacteriovoracaceae bacterium]